MTLLLALAYESGPQTSVSRARSRRAFLGEVAVLVDLGSLGGACVVSLVEVCLTLFRHVAGRFPVGSAVPQVSSHAWDTKHLPYLLGCDLPHLSVQAGASGTALSQARP